MFVCIYVIWCTYTNIIAYMDTFRFAYATRFEVHFFFQYVYILLRATFYEVNYVYCDILYLYRHSNAASATDNQIDGLQCARYVYNIIYYVYKI